MLRFSACGLVQGFGAAAHGRGRRKRLVLSELGSEVGNVGYDQSSDRMLVAVQGNNDLAVIDPQALTIVRRVVLPGCEHPHGMALDSPDKLVFVACDHNATLVTVDQATWGVIGTNPIGQDPDVLAYDNAAHRLYVAAESGTVSTLDLHHHSLTVSGSGHLADGAHVVVVDTTSHRCLTGDTLWWWPM